LCIVFGPSKDEVWETGELLGDDVVELVDLDEESGVTTELAQVIFDMALLVVVGGVKCLRVRGVRNSP